MFRRQLALAALAALAVPSVAAASVMIRASVEELAREADVVVRGKVQSAEGQLSKDGLKISTIVTIDVSEPWKGAPPARVQVQVPGGTYGGYGQLVQGAPRFTLGEDVVVFLRALPAPEGAAPLFRVEGMAQGKLSIARDDKIGEIARQDLGGLELTDKPPAQAVPAKTPPPLPVTELKHKVAAALR